MPRHGPGCFTAGAAPASAPIKPIEGDDLTKTRHRRKRGISVSRYPTLWRFTSNAIPTALLTKEQIECPEAL